MLFPLRCDKRNITTEIITLYYIIWYFFCCYVIFYIKRKNVCRILTTQKKIYQKSLFQHRQVRNTDLSDLDKVYIRILGFLWVIFGCQWVLKWINLLKLSLLKFSPNHIGNIFRIHFSVNLSPNQIRTSNPILTHKINPKKASVTCDNILWWKNYFCGQIMILALKCLRYISILDHLAVNAIQ